MKLVIILVISVFSLSGCTFSSDSYLVRWWNGNTPIKLSSEREKIRDICYRETDHLPNNTPEEKERSNLEYLKCTEKKRKNLV